MLRIKMSEYYFVTFFTCTCLCASKLLPTLPRFICQKALYTSMTYSHGERETLYTLRVKSFSARKKKKLFTFSLWKLSKQNFESKVFSLPSPLKCTPLCPGHKHRSRVSKKSKCLFSLLSHLIQLWLYRWWVEREGKKCRTKSERVK